LGGNAIPLGGKYNFFKREIQTSLGEIQEHLEFPPENPISPWEKFQQTLNLSGEEKKAMQQKESMKKNRITDNRPILC